MDFSSETRRKSKKPAGVAKVLRRGLFAKSDEVAAEKAKLQPEAFMRQVLVILACKQGRKLKGSWRELWEKGKVRPERRTSPTEKMKKVAKRKHIGTSTLARMLIAEGLEKVGKHN